ncbi:MAG: amino acid carrier protein [Pseudomonadales bacterium]
MSAIESALNWLDSLLGSAAWFPFVLLGVGLFFTVYLGFPQIRYFRHATQVLRGKHTRAGAPGDASHFQALSTALSGTVGTGNIGGVAFAIYLGGPAALFWMWMTAVVGMTTKFAEVTISHKYRVTDDAGLMAGGPMYYMERGLGMKWLAVAFALATVISSFGSGNLPQSNNIAAGVEASFGIPTWVTGGVLAIVLGLVIVGGIHRIAAVAGTLVPFMGIFYALAAVSVAISNAENILPSLQRIVFDVFNGSSAAGGFLGATFAYAFNRGVNRGLFSNEAGQGSAPIAHAAARADEPVSEGMVAILEPFIDTIVICTLTGLVILSSGVWTQKFANDFAAFDTEIVQGSYTEANPRHVRELFAHLDLIPPADDPVQPFTGSIDVVDGELRTGDITILHNRSIAEQVRVLQGGMPFTGTLAVVDGKPVTEGVSLRGHSLLHSVPLTAEAFKRSFLGEFGQYAVTLGLVLFAFSTAIAWSYYGDRAITYLFGVRAVMPYRMLYVTGFFSRPWSIPGSCG